MIMGYLQLLRLSDFAAAVTSEYVHRREHLTSCFRLLTIILHDSEHAAVCRLV